jgi:hypothetical protein
VYIDQESITDNEINERFNRIISSGKDGDDLHISYYWSCYERLINYLTNKLGNDDDNVREIKLCIITNGNPTKIAQEVCDNMGDVCDKEYCNILISGISHYNYK